ncbi:uncharacterized protein SOCE26_001660 [Sorangium cellulosum]|uniref:HTH lysR-type domain-containing protein n=1 Tax=Sorangium cellulosum TaxID=56 RepID=A0A2L0EHL2_SORCE|nr:LysR family transcriptional regulator [Sorangium cellulosum]AUX38788.1 uncharacterized protein SOCE26_001660 [Sorangium cellulosum]
MLAGIVDWDDVRHFLAPARTGSVRAAGSMLGVSHSTVARRVEALETRLGVKLFDRHRDGYLLTDAGNEMVSGAERVEREMAALERGLAGQDARLEGPVRVTCTDPFIAKILLRALAGLCEQHPGIELELDADAKNLDLSKRLPTYAGDPEPGLQRLAKPDLRYLADFWLLSHRDLRDNARLRAAREGITAAMTARAALFRCEAEGWRETAPLRHELAPGADAPRA